MCVCVCDNSDTHMLNCDFHGCLGNTRKHLHVGGSGGKEDPSNIQCDASGD